MNPAVDAATADLRPKTVVVHHRKGIGDVVWHVPYLRAIAAQSQGGRITLIARPSCRAGEVLAGEACVAEVLEWDHRPRGGGRGRDQGLLAHWRLVQWLKARGFDRMHSFIGRPRLALVARLAGIPMRHGFGFGWLERRLLSGPPFIERFRGIGNPAYPEATAYALAHGLVPAPVVPRLTVRPEARAEGARRLAGLPRPRLAFAVGTSDPRRHWGNDRYAELATRLLAIGCGVVLIGGPAEAGTVAAITAAVPEALRPALHGSSARSVQDSLGLLSACDACVGNDTGGLNLAAALGLPSLGLFGASPPLQHDPDLQGLVGEGMEAIAVDRVFTALEARHGLRQRPGAGGPAPSHRADPGLPVNSASSRIHPPGPAVPVSDPTRPGLAGPQGVPRGAPWIAPG